MCVRVVPLINRCGWVSEVVAYQPALKVAMITLHLVELATNSMYERG